MSKMKRRNLNSSLREMSCNSFVLKAKKGLCKSGVQFVFVF